MLTRPELPDWRGSPRYHDGYWQRKVHCAASLSRRRHGCHHRNCGCSPLPPLACTIQPCQAIAVAAIAIAIAVAIAVAIAIAIAIIVAIAIAPYVR